MNNNKSKVVAVFVILVLALLIACNMLVSAASLETTTGEIEMVQPKACPLFLCADGDYQYSQTNRNNAEANYTNAQAEQAETKTTDFRVAYGLTVFVLAALFFGGAFVVLLGTMYFRKS